MNAARVAGPGRIILLPTRNLSSTATAFLGFQVIVEIRLLFAYTLRTRTRWTGKYATTKKQISAAFSEIILFIHNSFVANIVRALPQFQTSRIVIDLGHD
jgi:hypothetical protein